MSIRDDLRLCYDTDTTELRMFSWIRLGVYEYGTKLHWEIRHESVKNTPKRLRTIYDSCTKKGKFVAVLVNSWYFLVKISINIIYPCLGITSIINVHRRDAVVLSLHLECQYQLLIVRRRLLRKN